MVFFFTNWKFIYWKIISKNRGQIWWLIYWPPSLLKIAINESINWSLNQSIDHSINQSINQANYEYKPVCTNCKVQNVIFSKPIRLSLIFIAPTGSVAASSAVASSTRSTNCRQRRHGIILCMGTKTQRAWLLRRLVLDARSTKVRRKYSTMVRMQTISHFDTTINNQVS